MSMKNPMTPAGIEPATFCFVAQHLNHCATAVPHCNMYVCIYIYIYICICIQYLLTAIGLSPGGIDYFTCIQNTKLVTNRLKSGGLHEKHVVATWNLGNHLSICL